MNIIQRNQIVDSKNDRIESLFNSFFEGKSSKTVEAYKVDIRLFLEFIKQTNCWTNPKVDIFRLDRGQANQIVLGFKNGLINQKLAPNTINRRLASVRSLFKLARTLGISDFEIDIQNVRTTVLRDTRGPQNFETQKLFRYLHQRADEKSIRDEAIFRLLHDLALRASELVNIDLSDFSPDSKSISILGKGMREKTLLSLPEATLQSLARWIKIRGDHAGPLFYNFSNSCKNQRLTRQGLRDLVLSVSMSAGIDPKTTHSWRHSSITQAIIKAQENGLGLELVLDHSRHSKSSISLLMTYRDRHNNVQGKIAEMVSKQIDSERGNDE